MPMATFTVNATADSDDGTCNAANCTLPEAINAANGSPGADMIVFNLGAGTPTSMSAPGTARWPTLTCPPSLWKSLTHSTTRSAGPPQARAMSSGATTTKAWRSVSAERTPSVMLSATCCRRRWSYPVGWRAAVGTTFVVRGNDVRWVEHEDQGHMSRMSSKDQFA